MEWRQAASWESSRPSAPDWNYWGVQLYNLSCYKSVSQPGEQMAAIGQPNLQHMSQGSKYHFIYKPPHSIWLKNTAYYNSFISQKARPLCTHAACSSKICGLNLRCRNNLNFISLRGPEVQLSCVLRMVLLLFPVLGKSLLQDRFSEVALTSKDL